MKIFRNLPAGEAGIRQKLLVENRVTHYFLYAIGEIILVVIGIIIALQLNNWNDERKENIEAEKLLQNLREELSEDSLRISESIYFEKFLLDNAEILFRAHSLEKMNEKHDTLLGKAFRYAVFTPRIGYSDEIYKELNSKNLFDHFQFRNIKDSLRNYYGQISFMDRYTLGTDQFTTDLGESLARYYKIIPQTKEAGSFAISGASEENFISEYDLKGFRNDKSLNPRLYDMVDIHKDRLGALNNMKNINNSISEMIKQELKH